MFPLGVNYMNQGVLVVFHINYNHVIAIPKVCWREDDSRTMCYDRTRTLTSLIVTTLMPTGIGECSWHHSLLNQVGHSPARAIGSATKYDSSSLIAWNQERNLSQILFLCLLPEAGVWKVQVSVQSWGKNCSSHLHAGFTTNKPLGITGKSN